MFLASHTVRAAPLTFVVNSVNDVADANAGDGICQTATNGECTLRAAIDESNAHAGADTINFNITGSGQHEISDASAALEIDDQVFINGYSQPGASANTAAAPAALNGVLKIGINNAARRFIISNGASGSTIKGLALYGDPGVRNNPGIVLNASNISLLGNYFGVNLNGNESGGQNIYGDTSNIHNIKFGGPNAADRNVFQGRFLIQGAALGNNLVQGNFMGIAPDGNTPLDYVYLNFLTTTSTDNSFLDNSFGACTLAAACVDIGGQNSLVSRNRIGITADGTALVNPGTLYPIGISANGTITNNTIAGFNNFGIGVGGVGDVVQGNKIGVDSTGYNGLESQGTGISISGQDTLIGGPNPGEGNIISNIIGDYVNNGTGSGIVLNSLASPVHNVTIQGNYIGTDVDGVAPLPNAAYGIEIVGAFGDSSVLSDVLIGGPSVGDGNIISGNDAGGIHIISASNVTVQGNSVGLDYTGSALPNGSQGTTLGTPGAGINIDNSFTNILIGGPGAGDGNVIASNVGPGVSLALGYDTNSNNDHSFDAKASVIGNSIYDNGNLAINLGGHINNDAGDTDIGPNNVLNYPSNILYTETGGNTDISYGLDVPAGNYRIEFFTSPSLDGSGFGQAKTLIGTQNITSIGSGSQNYTTTLTGISHPNITATATLINTSVTTGFGVTSEVSDKATQYTPPPPVQDLAISKAIVNPGNVSIGHNMQYDITLTNNGPGDVELTNLNGSNLGANSMFLDLLPPNLTFISTASPTTVTCGAFGPAGGVGPTFANHATYTLLTCNYSDSSSHVLHAGDSLVTRINVSVDSNPTGNFTNYVLGLVGSGSINDPDVSTIGSAFNSGQDVIDYFATHPMNNFAKATYSIATDTQITKVLSNPQDVAPGAVLTYNFTFKNNGPGDFDLGTLDGSTSDDILLNDLLPPVLVPNDADITTGAYASTGNPNVACFWYGAGSASLAGPAIANHSDYSISGCAYTGGTHILHAGQSISFALNFKLSASPPASFTNYAFSTPSPADPDNSLVNAGATSGQDLVDYFATHPNNNFAVAAFTPTNPASSINNATPILSILAGTGESRILIATIAGLLICSGSVVAFWRYKSQH